MKTLARGVSAALSPHNNLLYSLFITEYIEKTTYHITSFRGTPGLVQARVGENILGCFYIDYIVYAILHIHTSVSS